MPEWVHTISGWVIAHKDHITLLTAAVSALMAIAVTYLTWTLATENRLLRKAGTEPDVVAYLLPHPVHLVVINVVIANVGQGPALNVEVEFEGDQADFSSHGVRYPAGVRRRIASVLPQGERYVQLFGAGEELHKPDRLKDFTIHIHFTDSKGKARHTSSHASIKDFEGYGGFDPPDYEMAKALKNMSDKLDGWSSGISRLKVETRTQNEQTEIDRQLRERVESRRKASKDPPA
jgi:hypothetical protein